VGLACPFFWALPGVAPSTFFDPLPAEAERRPGRDSGLWDMVRWYPDGR
jgi:hypothetical protein